MLDGSSRGFTTIFLLIMTKEDKEGSIFGSRALSDRFGSSGRISFQGFHTKVPRTAELITQIWLLCLCIGGMNLLRKQYFVYALFLTGLSRNMRPKDFPIEFISVQQVCFINYYV